VTTGAAGSSASVTSTVSNGGANLTLDFTLPRGDTGATGSTGATGAAGPDGPANSLTIGTITTGAAGSSATAAITGTAPNQTLSLTIPRGDVGQAGATGATGANIELQATSTHIQWRPVGSSTWTNLVALTAITGPQGNAGPAGPTGPAGAAGGLTIGALIALS
jgi:hypothetical protein